MAKKRIFIHRALSFILAFIILFSLTSAKLNMVVSADSNSQMQWGSLPVGGGGFVTGIITGQNTMYLRTDVGGAYRYENEKWVQMLWWVNEDDKGYYGVDGLAIDPTNDDIVYLLCGTDYFSNGRTVVMKSTDGGRTFTVSNVTSLIKVHGNGIGRGGGERIAIDPKNPNIIYAAGRNNGTNKLIKSTNGGSSWTAVTSINSTSAGELGVNSVAVDKNGVVYATVSKTGSTNAYKSTDGGANWTALHASLPTNLYVNKIKINPEGNLLLTYTNNADMGGSDARQFVYNTTSGTIKEIFIRTGSTGPSQPVWEISWHPTDPQKMVASTTGLYQQQRWQGATGDVWGDHIWRSLDGGTTWKEVNMTDMNKGGISWITAAMHWSSSCVVDPINTNRIHVVSGNGIFASDNIWDANPTVYFRPAGVEETVLLDFISVPGGDNYSVIGDYTGFRHTDLTTYAPVHTPMFPKNGTGIAYNPHNPNVLMRVGEYRANEPMAYYSTNAGTTWTEMPKIPVTESDNSSCAITTINGKNRFLWSHGNNSYYSDDNGATWKAIGGLTSRMYFQVDSVNPLIVYAGGNNRLYKSTDGGATFDSGTELTSPVTSLNAIRIAHAPGVAGKLYYPSSGGLYVSTNGGENWTKLPDVTYASAVGLGKGVDDSSPHAIYIWGDVDTSSTRGIYRSIDDGQTWTRINDDQNQFGGTGNGNLISGDMNVYGRIYMSTVGMGIVYGDLSNYVSFDKNGVDVLWQGNYTTPAWGDVPCGDLVSNISGFYSKFVQGSTIKINVTNGEVCLRINDGDVFVDLNKSNGVASATYDEIMNACSANGVYWINNMYVQGRWSDNPGIATVTKVELLYNASGTDTIWQGNYTTPAWGDVSCGDLVANTNFFYDKFKQGSKIIVNVTSGEVCLKINDGEVFVDLNKVNGVATATYEDIMNACYANGIYWVNNIYVQGRFSDNPGVATVTKIELSYKL